MSKHRYKSVSVLVDPHRYAEVVRFAKLNGFRSVSELVRAALSLVIDYTYPRPNDIGEEIGDIFKEFTEPTTISPIYKRGRHKSVNDEI